MSTDILYPLLIGGGCVLLVVLVHRLTRPKPSMADITVPEPTGEPAGASPSTEVPLSALTDWHRSHEATVLDFFEYHDAHVGAAGVEDDSPPSDDATGDDHPPLHAKSDADGADEAETAATIDTIPASSESQRNDETFDDEPFDDEAFEQALQAHPAPEMRAELAAARAAGAALTLAVERDDREATARHREVYVTYRDIWLERLWQFSADDDRLAELRSQTIDPT